MVRRSSSAYVVYPPDKPFLNSDLRRSPNKPTFAYPESNSRGKSLLLLTILRLVILSSLFFFQGNTFPFHYDLNPQNTVLLWLTFFLCLWNIFIHQLIKALSSPTPIKLCFYCRGSKSLWVLFPSFLLFCFEPSSLPVCSGVQPGLR